MASADSLFIVLEGLDGSGKTTAGRLLATRLQAYLGGKVKLSYEPNEACCGGLYIRQVLEKKITQFSYETLAYAFAANRKDHGDRIIRPWLAKSTGQVLISDRYYLSSLVYQSGDQLSMADVFGLNRFALQPDVIFFLSVTPEICYERMGTRDKPQELFEEDFVRTREKYHRAIEFLRENHQEQIVEIDASGSLESVVQQLARHLSRLFPSLKDFAIYQEQNGPPASSDLYQYQSGQLPFTLAQFRAKGLKNIDALTTTEKGSLFLDLLQAQDYRIEDPLHLAGLSGFGLSYYLPGKIEQQGAILFFHEDIAPVPLMTVVENISTKKDFILLVAPDSRETQDEFFARDVWVRPDARFVLFPSVRFFGAAEIDQWLSEFLS